MISYNLQYESGKLSFQPNRGYKNKLIFLLLLALVAFVSSNFLTISQDLYWIILSIGCFFILMALYEYVFEFSLIYVFDSANRQVSQKVPGLFSRKLMSFDEVYIMYETYNCIPHYVLSNKKDRYGKSYAISDSFYTNRKGKEEQDRYETEVLTAIEEIVQFRNGGINHFMI